MYIGLHVTLALFSSDFNKNLKFLDIFKKKKILPGVKFHTNPPSGNRVVGYGQTEVQRILRS